MGKLMPISSRVEDTLDRSPVHRSHTQDKQPCTHSFVPKGNLEKSINLTLMFLDCGRKPEYLERTHACTGSTCKLHAQTPSRDSNLLDARQKCYQLLHRAA
ncbi:hypothetical protein CHARACLAT_008882 [Characodon lateralis]|uniref:Uncharacterized protein n=1 Tax=Characodon lateralis TaxID=208331 RepID=A0ABU7ES32_9TELE|nr:hypothetical protein [Characodon lateralis]